MENDEIFYPPAISSQDSLDLNEILKDFDHISQPENSIMFENNNNYMINDHDYIHTNDEQTNNIMHNDNVINYQTIANFAEPQPQPIQRYPDLEPLKFGPVKIDEISTPKVVEDAMGLFEQYPSDPTIVSKDKFFFFTHFKNTIQRHSLLHCASILILHTITLTDCSVFTNKNRFREMSLKIFFSVK